MPDENLTVDGTSFPPVPFCYDQHQPPEPDTSHHDEAASTPVDAIAHSLRRQHLQSDGCNRFPTSHAPPVTHGPSADAPFLGSSSSPLEVDPMYLDAPAMPRRDLESTSAGHTARHESNRLRRKYSTNFSDRSSSSHAKQTLVEGMIRSRSQCHVWNPPLPGQTVITANSSLRVAPGDCPLEVGHDTENDASLQDSSIEALLDRSRSGVISALERHGFPLYRTSKEVALRSQNLVRNKPRMRKRPKVREKPSMPTIPAVSGSTVASSSSVSS